MAKHFWVSAAKAMFDDELKCDSVFFFIFFFGVGEIFNTRMQ